MISPNDHQNQKTELKVSKLCIMSRHVTKYINTKDMWMIVSRIIKMGIPGATSGTASYTMHIKCTNYVACWDKEVTTFLAASSRSLAIMMFSPDSSKILLASFTLFPREWSRRQNGERGKCMKLGHIYHPYLQVGQPKEWSSECSWGHS